MPDWIPGIGGKGINIPEIPLLAKGGNVISSGRAIVGEAGPELIDLPAGARVSPLSGNNAISGVDYGKMTQCFVNALMTVAPELRQTLQVIPDENGIFKIVRNKAREHYRTTGAYVLM